MPNSLNCNSDEQNESLILNDEEKKLLEYHTTLKLQIELVPASCWYSNVRANVKRSEWDRIRKRVFSRTNFLCQICGGKGTRHPVECHEVWIYEEDTLTQILGVFQAICPLCHEVKHLGLAGVRGNGKRALDRFVEINNLDTDIAKKIKSAVFKQWKIRSREKWVLNTDLLQVYGIDTQK